jgi:hypothetical protein
MEGKSWPRMVSIWGNKRVRSRGKKFAQQYLKFQRLWNDQVAEWRKAMELIQRVPGGPQLQLQYQGDIEQTRKWLTERDLPSPTEPATRPVEPGGQRKSGGDPESRAKPQTDAGFDVVTEVVPESERRLEGRQKSFQARELLDRATLASHSGGLRFLSVDEVLAGRGLRLVLRDEPGQLHL